MMQRDECTMTPLLNRRIILGMLYQTMIDKWLDKHRSECTLQIKNGRVQRALKKRFPRVRNSFSARIDVINVATKSFVSVENSCVPPPYETISLCLCSFNRLLIIEIPG